MQASQQPASVDEEKKAKKKRRSRKPTTPVSAVLGPSSSTAASADLVPPVSEPHTDLPAAGKTDVRRRLRNLPRAPAVMTNESIDSSAPPVPVTQAAIHKVKAGGRNRPRRAYTTPEEKAALKQEQRRLKKARKQEKHLNLVSEAANATITTLNKHGLSCVVFGSLACKLYGTFRCPKDVDMLILQPPDTPCTAEQVKALFVDADPQQFYLKYSQDPAAPYCKLYYQSDPLRGKCKVDILLPGTMYLPDFSSPASRKHINTIAGIPLVPFSLLLLQKLQCWCDHFNAPEKRERRKQVQYGLDVRRLLAMETRLSDLQQTQPWNDPELFCEEFQQLTKERVKKHCEAYPKSASAWELLGFET